MVLRDPLLPHAGREPRQGPWMSWPALCKSLLAPCLWPSQVLLSQVPAWLEGMSLGQCYTPCLSWPLTPKAGTAIHFTEDKSQVPKSTLACTLALDPRAPFHNPVCCGRTRRDSTSMERQLSSHSQIPKQDQAGKDDIWLTRPTPTVPGWLWAWTGGGRHCPC